MYELNDETVEVNRNFFERELGMTYQQYEELDFNERQKLFDSRKKSKSSSSNTHVMIGSGEHATFINVKEGEKVMINGGNFITAGKKVPDVREMPKEDSVKQKFLSLLKK